MHVFAQSVVFINEYLEGLWRGSHKYESCQAQVLDRMDRNMVV